MQSEGLMTKKKMKLAKNSKAMTPETWKKIQSKFETCIRECMTDYRSDEKCEDSIEAVLADIWNLRDWLKNDSSVNIPNKSEVVDQYIFSHTHIRACGDIEIKNKHLRIDDKRHENTELVLEANHNHPSGFPVVFSVVTKYRENPRNIDRYEDATELAKRAIKQWEEFLKEHHLL
jgi:hypothetical protein